ncbi:MAG TPA: glycosyltransferase, partial [Candidatus Saccharimonadales bacterium]|nr:glycosyltransferase [Candidatus Saccharimonadales bacterium]
MVVAFFFFGVAAILELFVHVRRKQGYFRKLLASLATIVGAFAAIYLFISRPNVFSILLAVLSAYRIFNMLRVVEQRLHEDYLRNATRTTTLTLLGLQLLVLSSWWIWILLGMPANAGWLLLTSLQVVGGAILLTSILRTIKRTAWPLKQHSYSDKELPTVTVAIPARNETEDLHQCLQSIIASDYPKLEIIVLDDCSQDRRTPEIIREFAQDGVRFVRCEEPAVSWLPKNNAYARLAEEASGAYILFCGVDVRFAPHSIRNVVSTMLDRHKQMISILPMRRHEAYSHLSLIQAMRYWWELVPPRRLFRRPPVISSCWVIKASALQKMGGFGAVARAILPEAFFAKGLAKADGYSFLRAGISVGIESGKRVFEQHATATRMRYPQMHRRPEQVAIL